MHFHARGVKFCLAPERQQDALPAGFFGIMMDGGFPLANAHLTFGWFVSGNRLVKNQQISVQVHSTELQNKSRRLLRVFDSE